MAVAGKLPGRDAALALANEVDLAGLMREASRLRDDGFGATVTVSRKVFIPLTQALPGCLPLLHLRPPAAERAARLPDPRGGA